jgi:hypothetical protein
MSLGERCHACRQSLSEVKGPELMDREGHTYHLSCWSTVMDERQQEPQSARRSDGVPSTPAGSG